MPNSYNGWPASPDRAALGIVPLVVAGESFAPGVRGGDVHTVFQWLANQLHARVEPVVAAGWHQADDWGWSYKPSANSAKLLSCHASGTAIDYNATRHPNGKRGTFSAAQVAPIRRILAEAEGIIYWGGDGWGAGTWDEMHWEIAGTAAQVAAFAAKLRGGVNPTSPPPGVQYGPWTEAALGSRVLELGSAGTDVAFVQRWHGLEDDGYFGPQTQAKVRETQERNRLAVDGVVGPNTWRVMGVGSAAPAAPPTDTLRAGGTLSPGQRLTAPGGWFAAMQEDGNFVVYASGRAQWATNTAGNRGAHLRMQTDGNLVLYSSSGRALWSSRTVGKGGSRLVMQADGNLVIYRADNRPVWDRR